MKRLTSLLLSLTILSTMIVGVDMSAFASTNYSVDVEVTYCQTEARKLLDLINESRTSGDAWYWDSTNTEKIEIGELDALQYDYALEAVAMQRAVEIALYFDHVRANGSKFDTAYSELSYGYRVAGENIAAGYNMFYTSEEVNTAFLEEDEDYDGQTHRRTMFESSYTNVGVACVYYNGCYYWVEEFSRPTTSQSKKTNTATDAVDTLQTMSVEISADYLTAISVISDELDIVVCGIDGADIPYYYYKIKLSGSWPGFYCKVTPTNKVLTTDSEIAYVSDDLISMTADGTANLIDSSLGDSYIIANLSYHQYDEVVTEVTCTTDGYTTYTCPLCNDTYTDNVIEATGHDYTSTTENAIITYTCGNCDDSYVIDNSNVDKSALESVIESVSEYSSSDYTSSSLSTLNSVVSSCVVYLEETVSQSVIDSAVSEILNAIYNLVAYFDLNVTSENCTTYVLVNNIYRSKSVSLSKYTTVTLWAKVSSGYKFVGWYDTSTNRYLSTSQVYKFKIVNALNIKAVAVVDSSSTLTFANTSGQIKSEITKTAAEWLEVDSLDDLLPEVPYSYGKSGGYWDYDLDTVLTALVNGEDVTITPSYEYDYAVANSILLSTDSVSLSLYFTYDSENDYGSFVMNANIPDDCEVESIGVMFYYKSAKTFDPANYILIDGNSNVVSRFSEVDENGIYITNIKSFSTWGSKLYGSNWAAKGYVSYYDASGNIQTVYTSQLNIYVSDYVSK